MQVIAAVQDGLNCSHRKWQVKHLRCILGGVHNDAACIVVMTRRGRTKVMTNFINKRGKGRQFRESEVWQGKVR